MSDIPQAPGAGQATGSPTLPPPRVLNAQLPPPQVPAAKPKSSGKLKPGVLIGIVGSLIGVAGLGGVVIAATGDDAPAPIEDGTGTALDIGEPIDIETPATAAPPTAPEDTRPQELPSDTIDISEPSSGSVPPPPPPTAPITAPPVVTNPPEPPPTDPAPIPDVDSPEGGVEFPAGWGVVQEEESYVILSNGNSLIELYFYGPEADEALALTQLFLEQVLSSYVTDLEITEPVPLDPPTSSVISAAGLNYQGLIATNSGSLRVEGAMWGFVFTDGTTMVAVTTDNSGDAEKNIKAQVDILFLYLS